MVQPANGALMEIGDPPWWLGARRGSRARAGQIRVSWYVPRLAGLSCEPGFRMIRATRREDR